MSWEMTVLTLSYREPRNVQFIILFFNILQPAASRLTTKISHHRFNALIVMKKVFFFLQKNTPRIVGGHRIMNIKYQVLTNYRLSILIILWLHRSGNFQNYNHFRSDFLRECPHLCSCKWSGGKKLADCSNKGYTTIPQSISSEVQVRSDIYLKPIKI